jgi:hypothetical protein
MTTLLRVFSRSTTAALCLALVAALLIGIGACGSGGGSATSSPSGDTAATANSNGSTSASPVRSLQASPTPTLGRPSTTASQSPPPTTTPIVGDVNLTGHVADDIPGTLIAVGSTITSVVDKDTKPRDVYALAFTAGTTYKVVLTLTNSPSCERPYCHVDYHLDVGNPGSASFDGRFSGPPSICLRDNPCTVQFPPAVSGTYYLSMSTTADSNVGYNLRVVECAPSGQDSCSTR